MKSKESGNANKHCLQKTINNHNDILWIFKIYEGFK